MDPRAYFSGLARHNGWANERLLDGLAALDDTTWHADLGLHFRSLHGTFNHILLVEEIWLGRITGQPTAHTDLASELEADRHALRARLLARNARTLADMQQLPVPVPERLAFVSTQGKAMDLPLLPLLAHVFNHATHHRGQATAAAMRAGVNVEGLDIPYQLLESGA